MKNAFIGITGSGKTTKLMELYKEYIKNGINTSEILVLVRNRAQGILWNQNLILPYSSKLRITSYFGFIQSEIHKYWPLINAKNDSNLKLKLEPTFITIEMSQFLMLQIIEEERRKGKLTLLQMSSDRISLELLHNISKAALGGIEFKDIGNLLLRTRIKQDTAEIGLFNEIQEICNKYIERCQELGIIDYALAVDIYHRMLLKEQIYVKGFLDTTKHIMVEDIEEAVSTEIEMLGYWIDKVESFNVTYNTDGELGRGLGACPELVEELLLPQCNISPINKSSTSKHLDSLERLLATEEDSDKPNVKDQSGVILLEQDLRSDMLKIVGEKIISLIEEGASTKDIAIISPKVDPVMSYYLESILNKRGYHIANIARNESLLDDAYVKALITLASLCHPHWQLFPNNERIAEVFSLVLDIDRIRSHLLANEVSKTKPYYIPTSEELSKEFKNRIGNYHISRYDLLRNWVNSYIKEEPLPINRFLEKLFVEILLPLPDTESHLETCRQLIENSRFFLEVFRSFDRDKTELGLKYIELVLKGMKAAQGIKELRRKMYCNDIVLATPYAYLSLKQKRKIQIWTDVSSEDWYSSDVKEITNPHIFHPNWEKNRIFTDNDNEFFRRKRGDILIRRLIHSCEKQIIFSRSILSRFGYEQDSLLSQRLDQIR